MIQVNRRRVIESNGGPSRAQTCDPLMNSAFKDSPAGYGSYGLLTSVTYAAASESIRAAYFLFVCVLVTSMTQSVRLRTSQLIDGLIVFALPHVDLNPFRIG